MLHPALVMHIRQSASIAAIAVVACVPSGNATQQEAGTTGAPADPRPAAARQAPFVPSADLMRTPFEDSFERPGLPRPFHAIEGSAAPAGVDPGPDWMATAPGIWRIEAGRLCGEHARNHGIWLNRALPANLRIEFDAFSDSADGDLKAEYWGDGRSYATALSYTNATSYLTIYGGWHNKFHVLARINEHGNDRKEITVDPNSDDPREKPVVAGQGYHFKVERSDGKTVRWWIDGNEMLSYPDSAPLTGPGHDHFGFNDWDAKVCFDNVRVVVL
jgi:hypothetical protein